MTEQQDVIGPGSDLDSNACITHFGGRESSLQRGYQRSAALLVEHVVGHGRDQDTLVYPIVFLYRHNLELLLKDILFHGTWLLERHRPTAKEIERRWLHHRLHQLWPEARHIIQAVFETPDPPEFQAIEDVVLAFEKVDPESFAFRYAATKRGTGALADINLINVRDFAERVSVASNFLNCVRGGIGDALDHCLQAAADR